MWRPRSYARWRRARPPAASTTSYDTSFPLNEQPLSEGGNFVHNSSSAVRQEVQVSGALAFTPLAQASYDDAYAILNRPGYPANQRVFAYIHRAAAYSPGTSHEVELLLRASDPAGACSWYECLVNVTGGVQIMRFINDSVGDGFVEITATSFDLGAPANGDLIEATIVGSSITVKKNGSTLATATDANISSGAPGMAFFMRIGATNTSFCFSRWGCEAT